MINPANKIEQGPEQQIEQNFKDTQGVLGRIGEMLSAGVKFGAKATAIASVVILGLSSLDVSAQNYGSGMPKMFYPPGMGMGGTGTGMSHAPKPKLTDAGKLKMQAVQVGSDMLEVGLVGGAQVLKNIITYKVAKGVIKNNTKTSPTKTSSTTRK